MWPNDLLDRLQQIQEQPGHYHPAAAPAVQVCLVADDARMPQSSYTKEALQLRGGITRFTYRRPRKLRERHKTKYPKSRWQSLPEASSTSNGTSSGNCGPGSSVGKPPRRKSLESDLKMPVRRDSCLSLKMPVRQDSFVLRPSLTAVRLPHAAAAALGGANTSMEGKSTVDMISQVLADLDLIDQDEDYEDNPGDCWTI